MQIKYYKKKLETNLSDSEIMMLCLLKKINFVPLSLAVHASGDPDAESIPITI